MTRLRLRDRTRRHPLAAFVLLTFGVSWGVPGLALALAPVLPVPVSLGGYSPLAYVAVWGPAVASFAVVGLARGRAGLRAFVARLVRPTGRWPWYAAVLAGVPATYLAAALLDAALGGPGVAVPPDWLGPFVVVALLRLTQGPVEELGWRGFALPLLQRRYSGLAAAVLLGLVWGLWHAPALLVSAAEFAREGGGSPAVALLRLFVVFVATSVVVTAAYNGSAGSVPLAVLFHWLTNLAYPWETASAVPLAQDALTVLVALVVAVIGRRYLGRANRATRVLAPTAATGAGDGDVADIGTRRDAD